VSEDLSQFVALLPKLGDYLASPGAMEHLRLVAKSEGKQITQLFDVIRGDVHCHPLVGSRLAAWLDPQLGCVIAEWQADIRAEISSAPDNPTI
jgi:hypothetical protein